METKSRQIEKKDSGFALLMTLIVVSVIVSIGLTVLDLSIKQVRLSTNARESEIAFHAANAGMECARYWRRAASTTMEAGDDISPRCFSATAPYTNANVSILSGGNGTINLYIYGFDWGTRSGCSMMSTMVMTASSSGTGLSLSNIPMYIQGYPTTDPVVCQAGERCTIISSHGYNQSCNNINGYGSLEREVLLQF